MNQKRARPMSIFLVIVLTICLCMNYSPSVYAEDSSVKITGTSNESGTFLGSYYVVYNFKGREYRSNEIGPAMNRALWKKLSDGDKQKIVDTLYDYGDRKAQFGKQGNKQIQQWRKSTDQWAQANELWRQRIMNKYYPDIENYYSKTIETNYPEVFPRFEQDPTCSDQELNNQYQQKKTEIYQAWQDGSMAYTEIKNLKTNQVKYSVNVGSQAIIKLLLDGFFMPHATRGASIMSDAIAQVFDFAKNTYDSLSSSDPSPEEVIQSIEKILDKFAEVARDKKAEIDTKINELKKIKEEIEEKNIQDGIDYQVLTLQRDNQRKSRENNINQLLENDVADCETSLPSLPEPDPGEELDNKIKEEKKTEIQGKLANLKSEAEAIRAEYEAIKVEAESKDQAILDSLEINAWNEYYEAAPLYDLGICYVDFNGEEVYFDPTKEITDIGTLFGSKTKEYIDQIPHFFNQTTNAYTNMINNYSKFIEKLQNIIDYKESYYEKLNEIRDILSDITHKQGAMYSYYSQYIAENSSETERVFKNSVFSEDYPAFTAHEFEIYYSKKNTAQDMKEYYENIVDDVIPENINSWNSLYSTYQQELDEINEKYEEYKVNYENAVGQMVGAINGINNLYKNKYFMQSTSGTSTYYYDGLSKYADHSQGAINIEYIKSILNSSSNYENALEDIKKDINSLRLQEAKLIKSFEAAKQHADYYEAKLQYIYKSLCGPNGSDTVRYENVNGMYSTEIEGAHEIKNRLMDVDQMNRYSLPLVGSNIEDIYDMLLGQTDSYWKLNDIRDNIEQNTLEWKDVSDINYENKIKSSYQSASSIYVNNGTNSLTEGDSGVYNVYLDLVDMFEETGVNYTAPIDYSEDGLSPDNPVGLLNVNNIGNNSVKLSAKINIGSIEDVDEYGFIWTDDQDKAMNLVYYINSGEINKEISTDLNNFTGEYTYNLTNLQEGKEYYVFGFIVHDSNLKITDMKNVIVSNDDEPKELKLSSLEINTGISEISLSPDITEHFVSFPYYIDNITVIASVYNNNSEKLLSINDEDITIVDDVYGNGYGFLDMSLDVGDNQIPIKLMSSDYQIETNYNLNVTRSSDSSIDDPGDEPGGSSGSNSNANSGGSNGGSSNSSKSTPNINIGDTKISLDNIKTAKTEKGIKTTVEIDPDEVNKLLSSIKDDSSFKLQMKDTDSLKVSLKGQSFRDMAKKSTVFEAETSFGSYSFNMNSVNIDELAKNLGEDIDPEQLEIDIEINKEVDNSFKEMITKGEEKGEYEVLVQPVEYKVTALFNGKTTESKKFSSFVTRKIELPIDYNPQKTVTGVVLDEDGILKPVPTKVEKINGKYYVIIKSLTNSVYSVVSVEKSFKDIDSHWSKEIVEDLASRLIIKGIDDNNYGPDKNITRAEFTALLVRAMGLGGNSYSTFTDIGECDWFCEYIASAYEYGLISGYTDGSFKPFDSISREEAMAMIVNAIKLSKSNTCLNNNEIEVELNRFNDTNDVSNWSRQIVAYCIKNNIVDGYNGYIRPKNAITRAETAVIIKRMLNIIDII